MLVKEQGIAAGIEVALAIFKEVDEKLKVELKGKDGDKISPGDELFYVEGPIQSILKAERLVLNCMQRMSGIATTTHKYVQAIEGCNSKILDTRKTTPLLRSLEKQAVKIGGGYNHRFGLFDMILIKDNHVDSAGGITQALESAKKYITEKGIRIPIEIETRSTEEIKEALSSGIPDRIMFDNFSPEQVKEAVKLVKVGAFIPVSSKAEILNAFNYFKSEQNRSAAGENINQFLEMNRGASKKILDDIKSHYISVSK